MRRRNILLCPDCLLTIVFWCFCVGCMSYDVDGLLTSLFLDVLWLPRSIVYGLSLIEVRLRRQGFHDERDSFEGLAIDDDSNHRIFKTRIWTPLVGKIGIIRQISVFVDPLRMASNRVHEVITQYYVQLENITWYPLRRALGLSIQNCRVTRPMV